MLVGRRATAARTGVAIAASLSRRALSGGRGRRPASACDALPQPAFADDLVVAEARFFAQHRPLSARPPSSAASMLMPRAAEGHLKAIHASLQANPINLDVNIDGIDLHVEAVVDDDSSSVNPTQQQHLQSSNDWYYDEYAKIFNAFAPFVAPSSTPASTTTTPMHSLTASSSAKPSIYQRRAHTNKEQILEDFFDSFEALGVASKDNATTTMGRLSPRRIRLLCLQRRVDGQYGGQGDQDMAMALSSAVPASLHGVNHLSFSRSSALNASKTAATIATASTLTTTRRLSVSTTSRRRPTDRSRLGHVGRRRKFNIIKIRRKKMNRHKWKKNRRRVRDSHRYNKEKLRKKGEQRKKQE